MSTLWNKGYSVDETIHDFTVGRDPLLDMALVPADCVATAAHVSMLAQIGVLEDEERDRSLASLGRLLDLYEEGRFTISRAQEDGHTAIEAFLTEHAGDAGRRVHTGRSRNDQVVAALRLYAREYLCTLARDLAALAEEFLSFAEAYAGVPMPGRTHQQKAMLSSVGLWAGAYGEQLIDDLSVLDGSYALADRNPLGSAAGYGVPLPVDREETARLLGFGSVQNNVLAVSNSRGRVESCIADGLDQTAITISKCAADLILFSLPEFGYFELPDELCTGSSIMPQKKNPDGLELLRANAELVGGYATQIKQIVRGLPSGYNRDYQATKEPFLRVCDTTLGMVRVMHVTIRRLTVRTEALEAACTGELFATDEALKLVQQGVPFREAYGRVSDSVRRGNLPDVDIRGGFEARRSTGEIGNLGLGTARSELAGLRERFEERLRTARTAVSGLMGREVALYRRLPA